MGRYYGMKVMTLLIALIAMLGIIQGFGGYLVGQLSQFESVSPIIDAPLEPAIVKRKTLRLVPEKFYMLQMGTFNDLAKGQEIVDELAKLGYRVYTTAESPYRLWLGCFSDMDSMTEIPAEIKKYGQDIYVAKGLLNEVALSFDDDQLFVKERIVPVVEKSDILLKHSLKTFRSIYYQDYADAIWSEQVERLEEEIQALQIDIATALSVDDNEMIAKALVDYQTVLQDYEQSLQVVLDKKNDKAVLLAQSYLQQMIGQYHQFINEISQSAIVK